MTELLQQAFALIGRMPADDQDSIARAILALSRSEEPDEIEPEHKAAVLEGMAQAKRGEFSRSSPAEILRSAFDLIDR